MDNTWIKRITERLELISKLKYILGLRESVVDKPAQRLPSTSLLNDEGVYGRNDDRDDILNLIQSEHKCGNDLCIFVIVGVGELERQPLLNLYNEESMNEIFELKAWVCVPENFDIFKVIQTILESINQYTNSQDLTNFKFNWRTI